MAHLESPLIGPAPSISLHSHSSTVPTTQVRRTRSGCQSCRESKVKCDEQRPSCRRCTRLNRECDYTPRPRKKYTRKIADSVSHCSTQCSPVSPSPDHASASAPSPQTDEQDVSFPFGFASPQSAAAPDTLATIEDTQLDIQLPPECASILSPQDYMAIRHFRSSASTALDDTKSPESSGPALIWTLAQGNPMVLHMVCALGDRNLRLNDSSGSSGSSSQPSTALEHYAAALSLLAACTQNTPAQTDLENILGTLWLMIVYEQKHGDGCGTGLFAHLRGAASLLQDPLQNLRLILQNKQFEFPQLSNDESTSSSGSKTEFHLSSLTARIIIWMAMVDSGAALHGLGGTLNELLGEALSGIVEDKPMCRLRGLSALQAHSTSVYQDIWGAAYPQRQIIEDLQNSQTFCLHAELGQLRFLLARLYEANGGPEASAMQEQFVYALRDIQMRYGSLLITNMHACVMQGPQQRFLMILRFVLPFYFAVVLAFYRLTKGVTPIDCGQRNAIRELMALAFQAHRDEGDQAMGRIAWPLFIAALETDDLIHRTWIMERFTALSARGENYRRARDALQVALSEQRSGERSINFWELVQREEIHKFVL